ncbi:MAG: menaquinone biosynthesis decarboxylase [Rikenellaceae bacterium]
MYKNLREYIGALESHDELLRVEGEVSNELEIAEITDRVSKSKDGGKALIFKVRGSEFDVATNIYGSQRRMALALGVERLEELTPRIDKLLRDMTAPKNTIWDKLSTIPMLIEMSRWLPKTSRCKGDCQQVVKLAEQVNLNELPILKCWINDGGRFVTLPMVHTVDPDTGQRNVGMYRMQQMDQRTTGMHWHLHKTGTRHYEAYKRRGERMPVSVAIGGDPIYAYAATAPMPDNMDEYLLAGFLRRRGVKLVKSITNDIYVPTDCDFVLEGYVDPAEDKVTEGPFGDHTGFYSLQDNYPLFHITAITHRRDAIYPATIVGVPPQEDAYIAMATERIFLSPIRFAIQPEVRDMWMPEQGTAHNLAIVSIDKRYTGQSQKVILSLWGAGQMMFNKYLAVADSQVDIRHSKQLSDLLRRIDLSRAVVRGEGVLDVLDHATETLGYGGKLALDLSSENLRDSIPKQTYNRESNYCVNDEYLECWSTLILYIDPTNEIDPQQIVSTLKIEGVNYIAIFDPSTQEAMSGDDLLWLALANSDPRRDVTLHEATLVVDARSKVPGKSGNPRRFPNPVTTDEATIELVDRRWAEYKIGEFIESPSRKYRKILLSSKEDW